MKNEKDLPTTAGGGQPDETVADAGEQGRKRGFFLIGYYHYGVILTYLSVVAGLVGIFVSIAFNAFWGVVCLFISGLCDAFDGTVAGTRKTRTEDDKRFGSQIDSLSDMIAFGLAPMFIGFALGMKEWYYVPVFCIFSLCALIRLAYYNVTEETRGEGKRKYFEGLPVTNVAVAVPIFYLIATMFIYISPLAMELIMAACYLILAFLFVFRFRMPKAGVRGLCIAIGIVTVLVIALCLVRTYALDVPLIP